MKNLILIIMCSLFIHKIAAQYQGLATHFEALGTPYGGCGIPTELVESEHFVALNVFNRPNYQGQGDFTRPLKGADTVLMGEFQNGRNCGRWVKVTILDDCKRGSNSGIIGETPCNGSWVTDSYNGAELYMVVTDACGDNNAWCREIQQHLDLHTSSLNQFEKNGITVNDMYPSAFNNRKIEWKYVPAPNYEGDIKIHFMQNSQRWWSSILITNLPNGIHGVEQKINNQWVKLDMNSDMGQTYILKDFTPPHTIRVIDANDELLFEAREYTFDNPCYNQTCTADATAIQYTTNSTPVTGIKKTQEPLLSIFPNPSKTRIFELQEPAEWQVYSSSGQLVASGKENLIDLSGQSNGIYLIRTPQNAQKVLLE